MLTKTQSNTILDATGRAAHAPLARIAPAWRQMGQQQNMAAGELLRDPKTGRVYRDPETGEIELGAATVVQATIPATARS